MFVKQKFKVVVKEGQSQKENPEHFTLLCVKSQLHSNWENPIMCTISIHKLSFALLSSGQLLAVICGNYKPLNKVYKMVICVSFLSLEKKVSSVSCVSLTGKVFHSNQATNLTFIILLLVWIGEDFTHAGFWTRMTNAVACLSLLAQAVRFVHKSLCPWSRRQNTFSSWFSISLV